MLNTRNARIVFHLVDLVGLLSLIIAPVLFLSGIGSKNVGLAVIGGLCAASALGWFAFAHMGRALVQIAETNKEILDHLSRR